MNQLKVSLCVITHLLTIRTRSSCSNIQNSVILLDQHDWSLVRHAYNGWHPATDNLGGTDIYGTYDNDPQSTSDWSIQFNDALKSNGSTVFMFSNGDCSQWLITENNQFTARQSPYDGHIIASHVSTDYYAEWYSRSIYTEDPWISFLDHANYETILYGENSFTGSSSSAAARFYVNGADLSVNVWISGMSNPISPDVTEPDGQEDHDVTKLIADCIDDFKVRVHGIKLINEPTDLYGDFTGWNDEDEITLEAGCGYSTSFILGSADETDWVVMTEGKYLEIDKEDGDFHCKGEYAISFGLKELDNYVNEEDISRIEAADYALIPSTSRTSMEIRLTGSLSIWDHIVNFITDLGVWEFCLVDFISFGAGKVASKVTKTALKSKMKKMAISKKAKQNIIRKRSKNAKDITEDGTEYFLDLIDFVNPCIDLSPATNDYALYELDLSLFCPEDEPLVDAAVCYGFIYSFLLVTILSLAIM